MPVVRLERQGRLCRLTLDRPEKLNALNEQTRDELLQACHALADDTDVSVVVISGAGSSFSAGADLSGSGPQGADADGWAARRHRAGAWQRTLDAFEALPQITVARVTGHCIGGAALLAASCDIRVGDPTVQIRIPELAIGIPLTWAGVPRLAREIGLPLTRDLVMTGRVMLAEEGLRCGYLQRLAAPHGIDEAVDGVVAELLAMPAAPLAMTKAMTTALGRAGMPLAWADADLLSWSRGEPESRHAAEGYLRRRS